VLQPKPIGWAHAQHLQANNSAHIDRLFAFGSKQLTHAAHGSHLKVGGAVGSGVGVCDGDQLEGAGDGVIVGGNVDGATLGAAVGAGDGDGLGDCVQTGVLHAACSVVNGHGVPVPSEKVAMVRWRLERPPPPANVGGGEAEVRASDRKAYILRCSCPTQSKLMLRGF
jgi:hypothetical protein